jgi:putative PIN family toxin of toxin-antitoxin system
MKNEKLRIVIDTNVIISAFYFPNSVPTLALDEVSQKHTLLFTFETIQEVTEVIFRKKFDRYARSFEREEFIGRLVSGSEEIVVRETIIACKDPKDDKFLEAAVSGNADIIITGDNKLKELNPFRGIEILLAVEFLKKYS